MAYSAQDPYQDSEEEYRQRLRDLILSSGGDLSGRQTLPDGTIVGFASADSAAKQRAIEEEKAKSLSELASMRIDNNELGVTYGGMNSHRPATLANLVQPQEQSSPQYQPSPAERKAQIGNGFRNESTGAQYAIPSNPSPVYQDQRGAQSGGSSADNLINLGQRQNIPRDQLSAMIQYQASAQPGAPSAEDLYRQSFRFGIPIKDLIAAHSTMGAGDSARIEKDLKIAKARQELSSGEIESQVKRARLMELMGQDPSQMMPQGMPATGGQAPRVAAPVIQQGQPASSSGDADPMLLALRQKFLQRRFGNPPPGERWDEQGRAIPIPGHQKDLGEGQKKQVLGVQNLSGAIDEYRAELAGWSGVDALSPDKRAGMGVKYNNMMLQAKEAYNLGVLNGPDFAILTSVITDPRSLTGAITSNEAMDKQASELKRIMQKVGANVSNSRPSVPSQDAPQKAKTVVRTGTANGRKVVQYSDGSVDYAP